MVIQLCCDKEHVVYEWNKWKEQKRMAKRRWLCRVERQEKALHRSQSGRVYCVTRGRSDVQTFFFWIQGQSLSYGCGKWLWFVSMNVVAMESVAKVQAVKMWWGDGCEVKTAMRQHEHMHVKEKRTSGSKTGYERSSSIWQTVCQHKKMVVLCNYDLCRFAFDVNLKYMQCKYRQWGICVKTKNGQTRDWTQDLPDIYQML